MLFVTDPIDEFVLAHLRIFEGKDIVAIDSAQVELPPTSEAEQAEEAETKVTQSAAAESSGFHALSDLRSEKVSALRHCELPGGSSPRSPTLVRT